MQIDWARLFLAFDGRIGRIAFWIGLACVFGASLLVNLVPVLGQIAALLLLWPAAAVTAKRLHDLGRTAWLMIAPFVINIVCLVLAVMLGGAGLAAALIQNDNSSLATAAGGFGIAVLLLLFGALAGFAFLLWIGLARGQSGDNRFGPEPPR